MRRGRVFILLALILLLGAAGVFILLRGLGGGGQPAPEDITPTPIGEAEIVIAAQHISRGSIIPQEAVIISPYPADYLVETMMTDPTLVGGRPALPPRPPGHSVGRFSLPLGVIARWPNRLRRYGDPAQDRAYRDR